MSSPIQPRMQSYDAPCTSASIGIADGTTTCAMTSVDMSEGGGAAPVEYNEPAGNYYWVLGGLDSHTTYYAQQTIISPDGQSGVGKIISFNGGTGAVISSSSTFDPISGTNTNLNSSDYNLLEPFPGLSVIPSAATCAQEEATATRNGTAQPVCDVNGLLNYAMKLLIGLSGVVLVLRLMYEGYSYMVTDVPFLKASSKAGFFSALMGLMLALSAYVILNTINPKLVDETVNVAQLNIGVAGGDVDAPTQFLSKTQQLPNIICPGSGGSSVINQIAQSYVGKVTYSQAIPKGAVGSDGYQRLDCSGFANTVLQCAGFVQGKDYINSGSADIFGNSEKVNMSSGFVINGNDVLINNKVLNPGDLVGWTPSQGGGNGHVIIYIGNATFADSHSSSVPGGAIGIYPAASLKNLYGGSKPIDTIQEVKRTL